MQARVQFDKDLNSGGHKVSLYRHKVVCDVSLHILGSYCLGVFWFAGNGSHGMDEDHGSGSFEWLLIFFN